MLARAKRAEEHNACPSIKIIALDQARGEKVRILEAIRDMWTTEE